MRSRWTVGTLVLGVLILALPVAAVAQTSRVEGLALQGDYIKDYTGIFMYPSQVGNVGNLVYGELGNFLSNPNNTLPQTFDRSVGAVLGNLWDGRFGTWAIHLRQETPAIGQGDAFSQPGPGSRGTDPNDHTNEAFEVMWGHKMGTTSLGLRLSRSFNKNKDVVPGVLTTITDYDVNAAGTDPNLARNIVGVGGGIGFEMNPRTNVELAIDYQARTFETSATAPGSVTKNEDDGPATYVLGGRAMWQWQSNIMVVPVFRYYTFDLSNKTLAGGVTTSFDNTLTGWQAGLAGNWTLGTNDLFVLGATFAQNRLDQDYDIFGIFAALPPVGGAPPGAQLEVTETFAPQVFAALETHVNNWLTLRMGANKGAYEKMEIKQQVANGRKVEINRSTFNMNIGAGVKLGTLQLDAILQNDFTQNLTNYLNGTSGSAFPKVTATYPF